MLFARAAFVTAGALIGPLQGASAPRPLVQLVQDLDAAIPRAHLSDVQKSQLQSDREAFETAREAKEQGRQVDRRRVAGAVKSLHAIAQSGAFSAQDQKTLNTDIEVLRKQ